ncbi:MAG: glycosyltransferase family A protein [Myxococcota bacterium]
MTTVDILIPTANRVPALISTLSGVTAQTHASLRVLVADHGDRPAREDRVIRSLCRIIESRGGEVDWHQRAASPMLAEQRDYLLRHARADVVLFLDDDVYMEPPVVQRLLHTLQAERCGFVGAFPSAEWMHRRATAAAPPLELWNGPVRPETLEPDSPEWERTRLHLDGATMDAAHHLPPGTVRRYKVAWVAGCVMYDRRKLLTVGGFSFWPRLPPRHVGEEALVQNLLMRRWGGCAIMPALTHRAESPSWLYADAQPGPRALELLPEMVRRYAT